MLHSKTGIGAIVRGMESLLMGDDPGSGQAMEVAADPVGSWCLRCGRSLWRAVAIDCCHCDGCLHAPWLEGEPWPLVRLGVYEGRLRNSILTLKYGPAPDLAAPIGRALAAQWLAVADALTKRAEPRMQGFAAGPAVIQPVPMPWLRRLERSTDHARAIAGEMALVIGIRLSSVLSQRWGTPQARKDGAARRRNLTRSSPDQHRRFQFKRGWMPRALPHSVLLVDDVRTTGSTLREAGQVLVRAGVRRVAAAVVAVSHDDSA